MPVIVFEGFDGVGKTTLAQAYAEAVGGIAVSSLPMDPEWKAERQAVNAGDDVEARFDYFRRLNAAHMAKAREVEADGQVATLEGSIYRTVVTHRVLGSVAAEDFCIRPELRPDLGFLLLLPEAERVRRISERDGGLVHPSHWDETLYERRGAVDRMYLDRRFRLTQVNAIAPPDELVWRIRRLAAV